MIAKYSEFKPDCFYHVYNRANGSEKIFLTNKNYIFFLKKYTQYLTDIVDTYCYCLMPNHFHFLIKIKDERELNSVFFNIAKTEANQLNKLISKRFSNFFSSYTQSLNKMEGRKGSLFMKNFKHKRINSESYLKKLIHYIHFNPVESGLVKHPKQWNFSSYRSIISSGKSNIKRKEVIEIFDDSDNFVFCHKLPAKYSDVDFFS